MAADNQEKAIGVRLKEHRMARGLTQEALARLADVSYATLTKVESGAIKNPSMQVVGRLAEALGASLDDLFMVETLGGEQSLHRLWQDILATLKDNSTMYISGIDERRFLAEEEKGLLEYIGELKRRNIRQHVISCEGDEYRLPGEHLEYRWIPKKFFNPTPIYVYGDKLASLLWGPPLQVIILRNPLLTDAYQKQFEFIWERATPYKPSSKKSSKAKSR